MLVFGRIILYFTLNRYVNVLMSHVRFPMMSHHQLVELLLNPVSKSHTNMIVEKIREGLRFHKGEEEIGPTIDNRIYTPRLYTTEKFCASLSVDHFYELPSYHCRSLLFSSQRYNAEYQGDGQLDWSVDLYPKGVWFQRCLTVYRPSGKEVHIQTFLKFSSMAFTYPLHRETALMRFIATV